eukprot:1664233-Amphidinium_carterae.1
MGDSCVKTYIAVLWKNSNIVQDWFFFVVQPVSDVVAKSPLVDVLPRAWHAKVRPLQTIFLVNSNASLDGDIAYPKQATWARTVASTALVIVMICEACQAWRGTPSDCVHIPIMPSNVGNAYPNLSMGSPNLPNQLTIPNPEVRNDSLLPQPHLHESRRAAPQRNDTL